MMQSRIACGWPEPHSTLMFLPSGLWLITTSFAPIRRKMWGAMSEAAPLAQSMPTLRPSR